MLCSSCQYAKRSAKLLLLGRRALVAVQPKPMHRNKALLLAVRGCDKPPRWMSGSLVASLRSRVRCRVRTAQSVEALSCPSRHRSVLCPVAVIGFDCLVRRLCRRRRIALSSLRQDRHSMKLGTCDVTGTTCYATRLRIAETVHHRLFCLVFGHTVADPVARRAASTVAGSGSRGRPRTASRTCHPSWRSRPTSSAPWHICMR